MYCLSKTPYENETGSTAYYHTGVFTPKTNVALVVTVALGAIATAIGVIALLSTMGVLSTGLSAMGSTGALGLAGGGYVCLLAGVVTTLAFLSKHCQTKREMQEELDGYDFPSEKSRLANFELPEDENYLAVTVRTSSDQLQIHMFTNKVDQNHFTKSCGYHEEELVYDSDSSA